jgi:hypothetical protein
MRTWLLYTVIIVAALAALPTLAYCFPKASAAVFFIGTPVVVIGSGLGAKFVKEASKARRTRQH